jgi:hypothetical protein
MDLKQLMQKLEQLDKKQIINEVSNPSKVIKKEKMQLKESGQLKSSIAQALLKEFNLTEEEWKPTPEQEKWLGGADRQDPYIIARMNKNVPGTLPPVTYFKDPAMQAIAKQLKFPEVAQQAPAPVRDAAPAQTPAQIQAAQPAKAAPAAPAAPAIDPAKLNRFKELLAKAGTGAKPTATPASNQAQASGSPATPTTKQDPNVLALQQKLKAAGADLGTTGPNKDGVDGIMGPKTQAAMKKFPLNPSKPNPAINPIKNTDANTQGDGSLDVSGSMVGA